MKALDFGCVHSANPEGQNIGRMIRIHNQEQHRLEGVQATIIPHKQLGSHLEHFVGRVLKGLSVLSSAATELAKDLADKRDFKGSLTKVLKDAPGLTALPPW